MQDAGRPPLYSRNFVIASIAHFAYGIAFNFHLHISGFLRELGATEDTIGLIVALMAVVAIVSRPWLGRLMDERGRRPAFALGGVLAIASAAGYLLVYDVGVTLVVVRCLHGLGEAMLFASLFALASDIVPAARRIEGIAMFGVSGLLPMAIGGVLGDWILAQGGYPSLFHAAIVANVAGFALSLTLPETRVHVAGDAPSRGVVAALLERSLWPLWLVGALFATSLAAHFAFLKTFVLATGVGSVGVFFSAYSAAAVGVRVVGASLPERVGPKRVLYPSLAVMTIGFLCLSFATGSAHVIVAGLLLGAGHGFVFPIVAGMVVTRARPSEHGAAISVYTALFDAGLLIGGPLFGATAHHLGYPAMFGVAAASCVLGGVLLRVFDVGAHHDEAGARG